MPFFVAVDKTNIEIIDRFETDDTETFGGRLVNTCEIIEVKEPLNIDAIDVEVQDGLIKLVPNVAAEQQNIKLLDENNIYELRRKRNMLLFNSDWIVSIPDSPLSVEKIEEWKVYRQALRDLPSNTIDPENPVWPTPPE